MSSEQPAVKPGCSSQFIEVYEYPADCVASELFYHFSQPPYHAECKTPLPAIWNYKSLSFIMEYPVADALRILQSPVQWLDESDPASEIKLSLLEARRGSQVIVSSQHEISHRMIKKFFRKFGDVESCRQSAAGEYAVILTFKHASVAANLCSRSEYTLAPSLSVSVQLFTDALAKGDLGEASAPTITTYSLDIESDIISNGGSLPAQGTYLSGLSWSEFENSLMSSPPQPLRLETPPSSVASSGEHGQSSGGNSNLVMDGSYQPDSSYSTTRPFYSVPRVVLDCCVQIDNSIIRLVRGDPSEHMADVLVHSGAGGMVWKSFLRKWHRHPGQIRALEMLKVPTIGNVQVTTAGNLPASYVFGFIYFDEGDRINSTKHLVRLCLQHCTALKVKSIAFPAIGTGTFQGNVQAMARALISSIVDYMKLNAQSSLEIIDVVVFKQVMLKEYSDALNLATVSSHSNNLTKLFSKRWGKVGTVHQ